MFFDFEKLDVYQVALDFVRSTRTFGNGNDNGLGLGLERPALRSCQYKRGGGELRIQNSEFKIQN
jgi:hypothetical protein